MYTFIPNKSQNQLNPNHRVQQNIASCALATRGKGNHAAFARIWCDLHCVRSAVQEGDKAILASLEKATGRPLCRFGVWGVCVGVGVGSSHAPREPDAPPATSFKKGTAGTANACFLNKSDLRRLFASGRPSDDLVERRVFAKIPIQMPSFCFGPSEIRKSLTSQDAAVQTRV